MSYWLISYRFYLKLILAIGLMTIYPFLLFTNVYATDCNAKCEEHFDKPYQALDLSRCQAERKIACQWGIEHCDLYKPDLNRIQITEVIQWSHDNTNYPQDEAQCYDTINLGNTAYTIGSKVYDISKLAQGTVSKFNPYAILAQEMAKQVLRCSCKEVQWSAASSSNQPPVPNIDYSKTLYIDSASPANGIGTQAKPFNSVSQAYALAKDGALLNIKAGAYPEQVELTKKVVLIATGGTVTIGSNAAIVSASKLQAVAIEPAFEEQNQYELTCAQQSDKLKVYLPVIINSTEHNVTAASIVASQADDGIVSRNTVVDGAQYTYLPFVSRQ
jgi:hypothetical protein